MNLPFVLVCDDTRNIADAVVFTLQRAGYRAQAAYSALDCLAVARWERPALIFMDIMMPGMDGAMASELMKSYPDLEGIPVLLLSAVPEEDLRVRAHEAGAVGYLCKPFKREELLEAVRNWLPDPVPVTKTA